jgi:hypothetical protein
MRHFRKMRSLKALPNGKQHLQNKLCQMANAMFAK